MYWQIPSIQAFHSIVPGSIMEFYPSIDVTRDVGSRADTTHVGSAGTDFLPLALRRHGRRRLLWRRKKGFPADARVDVLRYAERI